MVDGAYTHAFLALLFTYFQAALKPLTLTFLFCPTTLNHAHHSSEALGAITWLWYQSPKHRQVPIA